MNSLSPTVVAGAGVRFGFIVSTFLVHHGGFSRYERDHTAGEKCPQGLPTKELRCAGPFRNRNHGAAPSAARNGERGGVRSTAAPSGAIPPTTSGCAMLRCK